MPGSHKQAVLSLSWSPLHRNILASCGDDGAVKLWDLTTGNCIFSFVIANIPKARFLHKGVVSAIQFHPSKPGILLSLGMQDRILKITDVKSYVDQSNPVNENTNCLEAGETLLEMPKGVDAETACFMGQNGEYILASNGAGMLYAVEVTPYYATIGSGKPIAQKINKYRIASIDVFNSNGNNCPLTAIAPHPLLQGLIAVASPEQNDVVLLVFKPSTNNQDQSAGTFIQLARFPSNIGNIFSLSWCSESYAISASSGAGKVAIWQVLKSYEQQIREIFPELCTNLIFPNYKNHVLQLAEDFGNEEEKFDEDEVKDDENEH